MLFTHDTEAALVAAVALVNSAVEPDTLTTGAELTAFLDEHEVPSGARQVEQHRERMRVSVAVREREAGRLAAALG